MDRETLLIVHCAAYLPDHEPSFVSVMDSDWATVICVFVTCAICKLDEDHSYCRCLRKLLLSSSCIRMASNIDVIKQNKGVKSTSWDLLPYTQEGPT